MYYDPKIIPQEFTQPHSNQLGVVQHSNQLQSKGIIGPYWALHEGGPRNGVLTAVEDFLKASNYKYHWVHIPAVLGLGVLIDKSHPYAALILQFYAPLNNHPLMAYIEEDRVYQYMAVLELEEKVKQLTALLSGVLAT